MSPSVSPSRRGAGTRSLWRTLVALALGIATVLALCAGVAQAEPPKLLSYGSFSSHNSNSSGVAVEGSGDLFVSSLEGGEPFGYGPSTAVKLDPSGKLLSPPSPFGSAHYSGVAVNPTNGDVYVLGEEGLIGSPYEPPMPAMIFVYDPNTGAPVGTPFEVSASRNFFDGIGAFTDVQIAADSAGNVYVPMVPENKVLEYSPSGTLLKTFTGSGAGALKEPTGVAIDSSGNLWVAGNNRIVEIDTSGAPVEVNGNAVEIKSEGVLSVALDGHGDVFAVVDNNADPCGGPEGSSCVHLVEYSSEGRQLADVGAGSFAGGRLASGVAVNKASERVYVLAGKRIWLFGPPAAPVVDRELTAEIGASEAKLGALVNPGAIQTTYRFEYGPTSAFGSSTPSPEGSVGEGVESHAVWASASGLTAGTTYHYRVVATNEVGTAYGPDQTFTTLTAEEAACPNEPVRGGFSGKLPDCRGYELVTPPVKSSSEFDGKNEEAYSSRVAADGEAVTLHTPEPRPGAPTAGEEYVATRGAGGWVAEDIMPLESYDGVVCPRYQPVYAYSEQFTKDVIRAGGGSRASAAGNTHEDPESCNPEGRQVVSGEPVGYENLLVRDNAIGTYQLVNVTPPGVTPADAHFQAASADLGHVIFTETSPLAAGARYGVENLYEWDEGALRLVSVLPDGTAVPGSLAARAATPEHEGVVSSDGSHVLFTYGGALYDRIDGQRTVQIDEQQGGSGPGGGGRFLTASGDGSKVFFTDCNRLTEDSTAVVSGNCRTFDPRFEEPTGNDLYEYDVLTGRLTDLTVDTNASDTLGADVQRVTPLGRHDSSYVYFTAKAVLASNTREITNGEGKTVVEGAEAGKENLYLWNGEDTTFIATGVEYNHGGETPLSHEQTSPDGKWLAFESKKSLTGYDNAGPNNESASSEFFLYSAGSGSHPPTLACASCNPTGELPVAGGGMVPSQGNSVGETAGVFSSRHLLTDTGQVFFETAEALVPSDTNGVFDVYEYEGGHVYLISSGTSSFGSKLEGASESGNDVFFRSNQALVPQDNQEGMIVIYDARVAGGLLAPASPPACTTADACRTPVSPQPSIYGAPASQTFSGLGNLAPPEAKPKAKPKAKPVKCKEGFVKNKKGKCVRKKSKQAKKAMRARKTNRKGSK